MNPYIKISIKLICIGLALALLFMVYQLYSLAQGVKDDIEHRNTSAKIFLLKHELKGVILASKDGQSDMQKNIKYKIQLIDYSSAYIPCMNKYIGSCDDLEGMFEIFYSQDHDPSLQVGQKVCKPKGSVIFQICK